MATIAQKFKEKHIMIKCSTIFEVIKGEITDSDCKPWSSGSQPGFILHLRRDTFWWTPVVITIGVSQ